MNLENTKVKEQVDDLARDSEKGHRRERHLLRNMTSTII